MNKRCIFVSYPFRIEMMINFQVNLLEDVTKLNKTCTAFGKVVDIR